MIAVGSGRRDRAGSPVAPGASFLRDLAIDVSLRPGAGRRSSDQREHIDHAALLGCCLLGCCNASKYHFDFAVKTWHGLVELDMATARDLAANDERCFHDTFLCASSILDLLT